MSGVQSQNTIGCAYLDLLLQTPSTECGKADEQCGKAKQQYERSNYLFLAVHADLV